MPEEKTVKRARIIGIIAQADVAIRAQEPETTAEVVEEISKSAPAGSGRYRASVFQKA
jgi:hypothetical protein